MGVITKAFIAGEPKKSSIFALKIKRFNLNIHDMRKHLHLLLLVFATLSGLQTSAAIPSGYYNTALGKSDQQLMQSLHQKIKGHYNVYYNNLWEKFKSTDCNGTTIIDRYSATQYTYSADQCGTGGYSAVGDCYNREHSVPNSWWGADQDTMYTDMFHMYPVDGYVNGQRGNHPFGDCSRGTPVGTGKLGTCTHSGYSGTVFEVADEYKGDFARSYFYMVVRYMDRVGTWTQGEGSAVFTNSSYKHLTPWAISQLLEWHRNDPVSTLEQNRNEAVYNIQHNRNPFIDHPELAEYLWGNMTGTAWTGSATTNPVLSSPVSGSTINVGTNSGSGVSKVITVKGVYLTKGVTVSVTGTGFSVTPTSLTAAAVNAGTSVTVTYNGTASNATGRLTITSSEVSSTVTLTATYNTGGAPSGTETIETWEGCGTGGYWTQNVQGKAFSWYFSNAGIWGDDHKNDALSCRFGSNANSYIQMTQDLSDGVSKVSFYAAKWNNDGTPTIQVKYSTDGGSTWATAGSCSPNSTWQQYIYNLNVTGRVRIKIEQTAGARLNIDDIAITSNPDAPVTNPRIIAPVNGTTVDVGTIAAAETMVSKTILVKGSDLTKVVLVNVSGTGFTVSPSSFTAASVNNGTTITVTYRSTEAGSATGTLTIGSSEASVTVNLTASKEAAMPTLSFTPLSTMEAEQGGASSIVTSSVIADNNSENITLAVEGNFELSLNRSDWARSLTLDPTGEVFYVRLADTATPGEFYGSLTASTQHVSAYADLQGTVTEKAIQLGDVNGDGYVNISDAMMLINHLSGSTAATFDILAADLNNDGKVNITDASILINIILNSSIRANSSWDAMPAAGGMVIENPAGEPLEVFDMDGECVAAVTGDQQVKLPAGIYLVTSETASRKVVVK